MNKYSSLYFSELEKQAFMGRLLSKGTGLIASAIKPQISKHINKGKAMTRPYIENILKRIETKASPTVMEAAQNAMGKGRAMVDGVSNAAKGVSKYYKENPLDAALDAAVATTVPAAAWKIHSMNKQKEEFDKKPIWEKIIAAYRSGQQ
jgi:hypothetical protein